MIILFFLTTLLCAYSPEEMKKVFKRECSMPGNTYRLTRYPETLESNCHKAVTETLHQLKKHHLSDEQKKEIKHTLKEIKEELKDQYNIKIKDSKETWTIYLLDKAKWASFAIVVASVMAAAYGDKEISPISAPIGAVGTVAGVSAHFYDHNAWVSMMKRNYKFIKKAADQF